MTGPEHYLEAERLLAEAGEVDARDGVAVGIIQRANVHAELARVAAYAGLFVDPLGETFRQEWADALGIKL